MTTGLLAIDFVIASGWRDFNNDAHTRADRRGKEKLPGSIRR